MHLQASSCKCCARSGGVLRRKRSARVIQICLKTISKVSLRRQRLWWLEPAICPHCFLSKRTKDDHLPCSSLILFLCFSINDCGDRGLKCENVAERLTLYRPRAVPSVYRVLPTSCFHAANGLHAYIVPREGRCSAPVYRTASSLHSSPLPLTHKDALMAPALVGATNPLLMQRAPATMPGGP